MKQLSLEQYKGRSVEELSWEELLDLTKRVVSEKNKRLRSIIRKK